LWFDEVRDREVVLEVEGSHLGGELEHAVFDLFGPTAGAVEDLEVVLRQK